MLNPSLFRGSSRLLVPFLALVAGTPNWGRAEKPPTQSAPAGIVIHTVLAAADSASIAAWVLVLNIGDQSVEVPGDLDQYITESYQLGDDWMCTSFRDILCPDDRGAVELRRGHCLGRMVSVRRVPTATAVRFDVDLGDDLGVARGDWVPIPR
jgi:hypothetical protein